MSGPLRLVHGSGEGGSLPTLAISRLVPREGTERALDELAARLADVCAVAVHPDEIAAVLESDGLTEEQIRKQYGRAGLFALAHELYLRVPRRYPAADTVVDPWRANPWLCALRGVVFALPGLGYLVGARLFTAGARETAALAASALFAWAWNQALAHRSYVWLGLGRKRAMTGALLSGAPVGAVLAAGLALALAGPGAVAVFAAGQAAYLAAATVLLVLSKERLLLLSLTPAAAAAAVSGPVGTALLVASVTGTVVAAVYSAVRIRRSEPAPVPDRSSRRRPRQGRWARFFRRDDQPGAAPEFARSLPFALFGLGSGTLMLLSSVDAFAIAALALSMGAAEWLLYRYRSHALGSLRYSRSPGEFQLRAGMVLVLCLTGYLAMLAALASGAAALWPGDIAYDVPRSVIAVLALGSVLWTALLLQAFGIAWPPALICAGAVLAGAAGQVLTEHPALVRTLGAAVSAAGLLVLAYVRLGRATAHR